MALAIVQAENQNIILVNAIHDRSLATFNNNLMAISLVDRGFQKYIGNWSYGDRSTGDHVQILREKRGGSYEGYKLNTQGISPIRAGETKADQDQIAPLVDRTIDFRINASSPKSYRHIVWVRDAEGMAFRDPGAYFEQKVRPDMVHMFNEIDKVGLAEIFRGTQNVMRSGDNPDNLLNSPVDGYFGDEDHLIVANADLQSLAVPDDNVYYSMTPHQYARLQQYVIDRGAQSSIAENRLATPYRGMWRGRTVFESNNLPTYTTGSRSEKGTESTNHTLMAAPADGGMQIVVILGEGSGASGHRVLKGEWVKIKGRFSLNPANYEPSPVEWVAQVTEDAVATGAGVITLKLDREINDGTAESGTGDEAVSLKWYQNIDMQPAANDIVEFFGARTMYMRQGL